MKTTLLCTLLFFLSSGLFSQESSSNSEKQFSIFLKRGNFTYMPSEYFSSSDRYQSFLSRFSDDKKPPFLGGLKNNQKILNPISLSYYNASTNLFFEFSYYKIELTDAYYFVGFPGTFPNRLADITRRESKFNVYSKSNFSEKHHLYFGLGVRNIFKDYSSQDTFSRPSDSSNTHGLQGFIKYKWQFHSSWELGLSLEPFYTQGNRIHSGNQLFSYISSSVFSPTPNAIFIYNYHGPNQKTYFYGSEIDLQLGFRLSDNWKLFIGYDYIFTKVRYENPQNYTLNYLPALSTISAGFITNYDKNTDHIQNFYMGVKAEF